MIKIVDILMSLLVLNGKETNGEIAFTHHGPAIGAKNELETLKVNLIFFSTKLIFLK